MRLLYACIALTCLVAPLSHAQSPEELEKRERCAVRLAIAFTGKSPPANLLGSVDPQAEIDVLLESVDFMKRFARFVNSQFNRTPGATLEEDAPYYLAYHVLAQNKPWKDLFIGPYRVEKDATTGAVLVKNDPDGLGYFRSPAWLVRYAGNEPEGYKLATAYRIMHNVVGLRLIPSTNAPDVDISANGRKAAGCRSCHYDSLFALDPAAKVLTRKVEGADGKISFVPPKPEEVPQTLFGGVTVRDDKDIVHALVSSENFKFNTCRLAFQFLYGRKENSCEGPVFDRCMKAFAAQGTMQAALSAIAKDPTFCQ